MEDLLADKQKAFRWKASFTIENSSNREKGNTDLLCLRELKPVIHFAFGSDQTHTSPLHPVAFSNLS
jgi:hypothetical protein